MPDKTTILTEVLTLPHFKQCLELCPNTLPYLITEIAENGNLKTINVDDIILPAISEHLSTIDNSNKTIKNIKESIKATGIAPPAIVMADKGKYICLSGVKNILAAKLADREIISAYILDPMSVKARENFILADNYRTDK